MEKQEGLKKTLGLDSSSSQGKVARKGKKKGAPPYIEDEGGSHNLLNF